MTKEQLLSIFLESQDFYELMQAYRFTSIDAAKEFEVVKVALRAAIVQPEQPHDKTIDAIMDGIDREQTDRPEGLWETSTGAAHGKKMLAEIKALFASAIAQPVRQATAPGYCKNCKDYTIEETLFAQPEQPTIESKA